MIYYFQQGVFVTGKTNIAAMLNQPEKKADHLPKKITISPLTKTNSPAPQCLFPFLYKKDHTKNYKMQY
jgi:hypothetical protein